MRITISGPPGSGTTSLARLVSQKEHLDMISAGEMFRELAKERKLDIAELGKLAETDTTIDAMIDLRQKELAREKESLVIEGRLSGWMVENADLKVWLTASVACRAKRIATRDGIDEYTARMQTVARESCEKRRYRTYYRIDIQDLSPYHIVLNSEIWTAEQLCEIVHLALSFMRKAP